MGVISTPPSPASEYVLRRVSSSFSFTALANHHQRVHGFASVFTSGHEGGDARTCVHVSDTKQAIMKKDIFVKVRILGIIVFFAFKVFPNQFDLNLLYFEKALPLVCQEEVYFLVQMSYLKFGFQVDTVIVLRAEAVF